MNEWMGWMVITGALVMFELFTGTFYVLMIAVGTAVGVAAALLGFTLPVQILVAAAVGVLATGLLHRSRFGKPAKLKASRDPNVNFDIGQQVRVDSWADGAARVMYRGAQWDVKLAPGATAQAGTFNIVDIEGSRLVVANS